MCRSQLPEGSLQQFKWYSPLVTLPFAFPFELQHKSLLCSRARTWSDFKALAEAALLVVKQTCLARILTFKLKASGGQLLSSLASSAKSIMLKSPQPCRKYGCVRPARCAKDAYKWSTVHPAEFRKCSKAAAT